jgi:hypothetical protein
VSSFFSSTELFFKKLHKNIVRKEPFVKEGCRKKEGVELRELTLLTGDLHSTF